MPYWQHRKVLQMKLVCVSDIHTYRRTNPSLEWALIKKLDTCMIYSTLYITVIKFKIYRKYIDTFLYAYNAIKKFEMFQTIVSSIHLKHIHKDTTFVWHRKDRNIETKQNLQNLYYYKHRNCLTSYVEVEKKWNIGIFYLHVHAKFGLFP